MMMSGTVPRTTLVAVKPSSVRRRRPRRVRTPIATPSGTATATATTNARIASAIVAGRRWAMMSDTGSLVIMEVPRSPLSSPRR